MRVMTGAHLWILSAPSGAGKTMLCRRLVTVARSSGWDVAGLITPAVCSGGIKIGIDAVAPRNMASRRLAQNTPSLVFNQPVGRQWHFDSTAVAWGDRQIALSTPCDLLIIDELGPLEFQHSQGWVSAFDALGGGRYRLGIVVVRPDLIAEARQRLPVWGVIEPDAAPFTDEALHAWIQALALGAASTRSIG